MIRSSGVAAAGEPKQALEAERQVEIAARPEAALREGVEPREPALAQGEPGRGVGADDDVGLVAWAMEPTVAAIAASEHLPGAADVAEADLERRLVAGRRRPR